ncbi:MAG: FHA domain-containing protein [Spirochaetia bacterium]
MDETITSESSVGKRLGKIQKEETLLLSYQGKTMSVTGTVTIGRDRDNSIYLDDQLVSRHHAVMQKIKMAFFVKDLSSKNGTYVNSRQIPKDKYVKLSSGDTIRVGRTELKIR